MAGPQLGRHPARRGAEGREQLRPHALPERAARDERFGGDVLTMTRVFQCALAALCAWPVWAQTEAPITREGRYWVQTVDGNVQAAPGGRLRVESVGSIVIRGDQGNQVRYTAKKRVQAGSEAEAMRLLERAALRPTRQGPTVALVFENPRCGRCNFSNHPDTTAPRSTQETILNTHGGSVEVYDIEGRVNGETAGGSIRMDRIGSSVRAATAGGSITLGTIGGPVRCETAGGSITLGSAHGDAVLQTSGGSIEAEQVDGKLRAERLE